MFKKLLYVLIPVAISLHAAQNEQIVELPNGKISKDKLTSLLLPNQNILPAEDVKAVICGNFLSASSPYNKTKFSKDELVVVITKNKITGTNIFKIDQIEKTGYLDEHNNFLPKKNNNLNVKSIFKLKVENTRPVSNHIYRDKWTFQEDMGKISSALWKKLSK